jgi:hypothetical protein
MGFYPANRQHSGQAVGCQPRCAPSAAHRQQPDECCVGRPWNMVNAVIQVGITGFELSKLGYRAGFHNAPAGQPWLLLSSKSRVLRLSECTTLRGKSLCVRDGSGQHAARVVAAGLTLSRRL